MSALSSNDAFDLSFERISSSDNIRSAYLDVVRKFDDDRKSHRYRGIDGLNVNEMNFNSESILKEVRDEMVRGEPIEPAYITTIPKKNGKKRYISVYSVKDRIKAEAVYRILEPFFDKYLSRFLFSYRSSHPSYYAARSVIRRYKRYYGQDHMLVTDISDYADSINHDLLIEKFRTLGLEDRVNELVESFVRGDINIGGERIKRTRGVLTGTPLYALLSNLYMDEFDRWAGHEVALYRRVGDDIIAIDKNQDKIKAVHERLLETASKLKLNINQSKQYLISDTTEFSFLGYRFCEGKILFDKSSVNRALAKLRNDVRLIRGAKIPLLFIRKFNDDIAVLIDQKPLVDDVEHIKAFSSDMIGVIASRLYGINTPNTRYETSQVMKRIGMNSLMKHYVSLRKRYEK